MRHSDPRLTMNRYTRAKLHDLGAAVDKLPQVGPAAQAGPAAPEPVSEVLAATGTDGDPADRLPSLALPLTQRSGSERGRLRIVDEENDSGDGEGETKKPLESQGFENDQGASKSTETERAGISQTPISAPGDCRLIAQNHWKTRHSQHPIGRATSPT